MLWPGLHNTHVIARPTQYTVLEGTQSPQRCPLLLVAMWPDVSLTEDSSASTEGIHQSKGNQNALIEIVKGRAGENAESAHSAYLNICDENYPTLAFGDKIILRHIKDVRPASLCLSLI